MLIGIYKTIEYFRDKIKEEITKKGTVKVKPTIYDVAKKAGVSIATVSKVINQTGRISEKTIKKVNEVMMELDYQPSSVAAALTGKRRTRLVF